MCDRCRQFEIIGETAVYHLSDRSIGYKLNVSPNPSVNSEPHFQYPLPPIERPTRIYDTPSEQIDLGDLVKEIVVYQMQIKMDRLKGMSKVFNSSLALHAKLFGTVGFKKQVRTEHN